MTKYHVLYEALIETTRTWGPDSVDEMAGEFRIVVAGELKHTDPDPSDNLILSVVEEPIRLPTTPGSVISAAISDHPGWVLTRDNGWVSLASGKGGSVGAGLASGLNNGERYIVHDAGKVDSDD